ncbi:hypothetical protein AB0J40_18415 [Amycolatopsis sp. NPDC049691]|uniref:hypothetical protein n=1 Tax=Amycolatopsis sp. NPDC049691 TaxID=3155155 RepID=UPI00341EF254
MPLLFTWAEGGKTPPLGRDRLRELGFRLIICPISTLLAATEAMRAVLGRIAADGTPAGVVGDLPGLTDFAEPAGLPEIEGIAGRFGDG